MSRTRTITLTLGSVAAGAVLATGVTGLALADDQATPAPSASSSAGAPADSSTPGDSGRGTDGMRGRHDGPGGGMHGMRGPGRLGEALHGEMVVKADDGTISTVRQVRGTATAVRATSITVEAEDGYTGTFAITADTEVRVGLPQRGVDAQASTSTIADVAVGDVAHVHGTVAGSTATASHVMAMTAEQAAELEAQRAQHEAEHQARETGGSSGSSSTSPSGTGASTATS